MRVAAAAGSALQPAAIALLEAASPAALAGSKPGDWQLLQLSATSEVGRLGCCCLGVRAWVGPCRVLCFGTTSVCCM